MRTARPRGLLHALPTLLLVALPAAVVGGGGGGGGGAPVALDFASEGAVAGDRSLAARAANAALLSALLTPARLPPGSSLTLSGGSFHLLGGARGAGLRDVTVVVDGSLVFDGDLDHWPTAEGSGDVLGCLYLQNSSGVTLTSSLEAGGVLDGQGAAWWGIPGVGYLERGENRPKLLELDGGRDILVEKLLLKDSPYWTFWAHGMDGLEVRHTRIDARRTSEQKHTTIDLTAFNTDGFDVTGRNVWIHDCEVWNQDDSVCVKDDSQDMVFERISASGLGLTIGSIGGSTVRNITFKDIVMPDTYKGIYMKFRGDGLVEDVLYQNITIVRPEQWGVWIGPAQQSDSDDLCAAHPCSICWPTLEALGAKCNAPAGGQYRNVVLRDVTIIDPKTKSPGVVLASDQAPMKNIVFDNVVVNYEEEEAERDWLVGKSWWKEPQYFCKGVASGVALGGTSPVPACFNVTLPAAPVAAAAAATDGVGTVA